jgi:hypothetical protein
MPVPSGDDFDDDAAVLNALDGFITGIDAQLLADAFLNRDLAAFSYSTAHDMNRDR